MSHRDRPSFGDPVIKRRRVDDRKDPPVIPRSTASTPKAPPVPRISRNKPSLKDFFWESFYTKPAKVPDPPAKFDYDAETTAIAHLCKTFIDASPAITEEYVKKIELISNDFALQSPLTPPSSIVAAVDAGAVGETFRKAKFEVCRCRKDARKICEKASGSDWYSGPCGDRVVRSQPYSFVHVNLSRQIDSVPKFIDLVKPAFEEKRVVFRVISGDSGLTLALLAPDKEEERLIRRLLREKRFKDENGIRIFQISPSLLGR